MENKEQKRIIALLKEPSKWKNMYFNNTGGLRILIYNDWWGDGVKIYVAGYNGIIFGEVKFKLEEDCIRLKFHNQMSLTRTGGGGYSESDTLTTRREIKYYELTNQEDINNNLIPLVFDMVRESWNKIKNFLNQCVVFDEKFSPSIAQTKFY